MRPGDTRVIAMPRWLDNLLWRLKRWNARQNCEANHHHETVENEVHAQRAGTFVRATWCRYCSHVEWID
jgi:hypothetical protein